MSENRPTQHLTEADLEASLHAVIAIAFPGADIEIQHQRRFKFHVGKALVDIDGGQSWAKEGRADIVLLHKGRPLAVVELKRKGLKLHDEDRLQGVSYARMLDPIAPLVVVSNGEITKQYCTYTGQEWNPVSNDERQLDSLINNALTLATDDIRKAAQTLMGTVCDVWSAVVKESTAEKIESLSGELRDSHVPFARDFLIPREATRAVIEALEHSCFVILEGEPLTGKSNVLRELVNITEQGKSLVPLYLEDGGGGYLQCLADALARTVKWPFKIEDARFWLQCLARDQEMKLVIIIDHYWSTSETSQRELEDLVRIAQNGGFSVVVAMDDALVDGVIKSRNGRALSLLGRVGETVTVHPLQDNEFEHAVLAAKRHGVTMMEGSFRSDDYRRPWIFRSVICNAMDRSTGDESRATEAPPLLGIDFINYVREHYDDVTLRRHYHELARVTLDDYLGAGRSDRMEIEAASAFLLRNEALKDLANESRQYLLDCGALRQRMYEDLPVFRIGFYEMLVSELASVIADRLRSQVESGVESAMEWLMSAAEVLPMGEIIAARAIVALIRSGNDPIPLCRELLGQTPIQGLSSPRTRFAIRTIDLPIGDVDDTGRLDETFPEYYSDNILPWITLSHVLAAHPLRSAEIGFFPQMFVLMEVAKSVVALRRPGNTAASYELLSQEMNDGTFVPAWSVGIIEPVTYAVFKMFRTYPGLGEAWMMIVKEMDSAHLLARTYTVLIELIRLGGLQGHWAGVTAERVLLPLLIKHPNIPAISLSLMTIGAQD